MKTQLRFITDAVEHTNRGETVGQVEARRLISDVGDLASAVIAQLADGIDRSQEVLQENDTLLRRATEMSCPSKSAYDLAASERSIVLLHNEVESLLQYPADPFLFTGMQNYRCVNRGGSGIVIVIIIITSTFEQWRRNEFESGREAPVRRKASENVSLVVPLHRFGPKSTISRYGGRFRGGQYSLVRFLFAVFLLYGAPCPAICKSGDMCPTCEMCPSCPMEWASLNLYSAV